MVCLSSEFAVIRNALQEKTRRATAAPPQYRQRTVSGSPHQPRHELIVFAGKPPPDKRDRRTGLLPLADGGPIHHEAIRNILIKALYYFFMQ
jgi:hypothetical protein